MTSNPNHLLVIDDEEDICELIKDVAEGIGFEVSATTSADEFLTCVLNISPSVIVLDLHMPEVDGIELLRFLGEQKYSAKIVLISGADARVLATARRLGETHGLDMLGVMQKPITVDDLEELLEKAK